MAYGLKYRGGYKTRDGVVRNVDIYEDGYTGAIIDVGGLYDSLPVAMDTDGDDTFKAGMVSHYRTYSFRNGANFNLSSFDFANKQHYKVIEQNVTNSSIQFVGYILPFELSEPYTEFGKMLKIKCTDGLKFLKSKRFAKPSATTLKISMKDMLCMALSALDYPTEAHIYCNLYELDMVKLGGDCPLSQTYTNVLSWYDDNGEGMYYWDVLEAVCTTFNLIGIQRNGVFEFVSINEMNISNQPGRRFSSAGVYLGNLTRNNTFVSLATNSAFNFIDAATERLTEPRFQLTGVKQLDKISNEIRNGFFKDFTDGLPNYWSFGGSGGEQLDIEDVYEDNGLRIDGVLITEIDNPDNAWMASDIIPIDSPCNILFEGEIEYSAGIERIDMMVEITGANVDPIYLVSEGIIQDSYSNGLPYISYYVDPENSSIRFSVKSAYSSGEGILTKDYTHLQVRLYRGISFAYINTPVYLIYKRIRVVTYPLAIAEGTEAEKLIMERDTDKVNYKEEEISYLFFDNPYKSFRGTMYLGDSETKTRTWYRVNESATLAKPIIEKNMEANFQLLWKFNKMVEGQLVGDVKLYQPIVASATGNKYITCDIGESDISRNHYNVVLLEYQQPTISFTKKEYITIDGEDVLKSNITGSNVKEQDFGDIDITYKRPTKLSLKKILEIGTKYTDKVILGKDSDSLFDVLGKTTFELGSVFLKNTGNKGIGWKAVNDLGDITDAIETTEGGWQFKTEDSSFAANMVFSNLTADTSFSFEEGGVVATDQNAWMLGGNTGTTTEQILGIDSANNIGVDIFGNRIATFTPLGNTGFGTDSPVAVIQAHANVQGASLVSLFRATNVNENYFFGVVVDSLNNEVQLINSGLLKVKNTWQFDAVANFAVPATSPVNATTNSQLPNWGQVQSLLATGIKYGVEVKTISLTNITLSGPQTINGYTVVAGDRVLVAGQTTVSQNGVYIAASGAWARATDSDTDAELRQYVYAVTNGTYSGYKYINSNQSAITVGTTAITYSVFDNNTEIDPVFVAWRDTSRTKNYVYAAPSGGNGAASFRQLGVADISDIATNYVTLGTTQTISGFKTFSNAKIEMNQLFVNAVPMVLAKVATYSYLNLYTEQATNEGFFKVQKNATTFHPLNFEASSYYFQRGNIRTVYGAGFIKSDASGNLSSATIGISDVASLQTTLNGKQSALNGTGFVKMAGTSISYVDLLDGSNLVKEEYLKPYYGKSELTLSTTAIYSTIPLISADYKLGNSGFRHRVQQSMMGVSMYGAMLGVGLDSDIPTNGFYARYMLKTDNSLEFVYNASILFRGTANILLNNTYGQAGQLIRKSLDNAKLEYFTPEFNSIPITYTDLEGLDGQRVWNGWKFTEGIAEDETAEGAEMVKFGYDRTSGRLFADTRHTDGDNWYWISHIMDVFQVGETPTATDEVRWQMVREKVGGDIDIKPYAFIEDNVRLKFWNGTAYVNYALQTEISTGGTTPSLQDVLTAGNTATNKGIVLNNTLTDGGGFGITFKSSNNTVFAITQSHLPSTNRESIVLGTFTTLADMVISANGGELDILASKIDLLADELTIGGTVKKITFGGTTYTVTRDANGFLKAT